MGRISHLWSQQDDTRLRRLVADGLTARVIAERLGCSRNAVMGRIHRLKLTLHGARTAEIKKDSRPPRRQAASRPSRDSAEQAAQALPSVPVTIPAFPDLDSYFRPLPGTEAVSLAEMAGGMCHWPVNGRYGREPIYCGLPADGPYCSVHHRLAYQPKSSLQEKRHGACA